MHHKSEETKDTCNKEVPKEKEIIQEKVQEKVQEKAST